MTERGAEEHLHAIRLLMERATIYRAISAPTALVGAFAFHRLRPSRDARSGKSRDDCTATWMRVGIFPALWTLVFLITLAANTLFIWRGARQRGEAMVSAGMKLALRSVAPGLFAGGAISAVLTLTTSINPFCRP